MKFLDRFYEKFDEDKRLARRHGQVEFFVTNFYINKILDKIKKQTGKSNSQIKIADIGAGTGAYSVPLFKNGYDVTAVEFATPNLKKLRAKNLSIKTFLGDATNLDMLMAESFDLTLLFGPMYHLLGVNQKQKALAEAKRITKHGGYIMVAYYLNDYAVVVHGFRDGNILQSIKQGRLDDKFHIVAKQDDVFTFDRLEDINKYKIKAGLKRIEIFAPDGASDYMRDVLNKMDNQTFEQFKKYQLATSKNKSLLGASSHAVDVLKKL